MARAMLRSSVSYPTFINMDAYWSSAVAKLLDRYARFIKWKCPPEHLKLIKYADGETGTWSTLFKRVA